MRRRRRRRKHGGTSGRPPPTAPVIPPEVAARLRSFLRPPFPLRVFEVVDGRIEMLGPAPAGASTQPGSTFRFSSPAASARAVLAVGSLAIGRAGRRVELGRVDADVTIEEGQVTVRELVAAGGAITGTLRGTVGYTGVLALKGELSARLENIAALAGRPGAAGGTARFEGEITGNWRDPAGAGVSCRSGARRRGTPLAAGAGPGCLGRRSSLLVAAAPAGRGGRGDLRRRGRLLRRRACATGSMPRRAPSILRGCRPRRAGSPPGCAGSRALCTGRAPGPAPRLRAAAVWPRGSRSRPGPARRSPSKPRRRSTAAGSRSPPSAARLARSTVAGAGSWSPEEGFSARVDGTVGDLAQLLPPGKIALGGSGRFEGDFTADAQGPRFTGAVHLAKAAVGALRGIEGSARLAAAAGSVRLTEGAVVWPGGRGSVSGTVEIPSGRLDLVAVLPQLSLQGAVRLLGTDPRHVDGDARSAFAAARDDRHPEVEGEVSGRALRYRTVALDDATLSLTFAARRLGISRLRLRRGSTELTFRGGLGEGRVIEGEFESPAFVSPSSR